MPPASGKAGVAAMIDHTLLRADATRAEILQVCEEALSFGFASACVNSYWVPLVAQTLAGSGVKCCSVIGFPLGASSTEAKVAETRTAVRDGAREIDMVLNIGALRGGDLEAVHADILAVVDAARSAGAIVKVILETALLDDSQKIEACRIARQAGAAFVKTSTGFGPAGATVHDVALLRSVVGTGLGVKASGGIRTREDFERMVAAGATRIGASSSVKIVQSSAVSETGTGY